AHTIADLLLRFPAPPSAVRPAMPLMPQGALPSADALAQRLEGSLRQSGLFHESHLARWYRGDLPRAALIQEPQQWRTLTFRPAEGSVAAAPWRPAPGTWGGVSADVSAGVSIRGAAPIAGGGGASPLQIVAQAPGLAQAGEAVEAVEASREPAPLRGGEPIAESLQGVLRHQLELLVNPVIRWEGDVWSGIFMALAIQLPAGFDERARQEAEEEGGQDEAWASELTLVLPGLGELAVQLRLVARRLSLTLDSPEAAVVSRLEVGLPRLARRLEALGFEARLAARLRPEAGE
ncbi:flagellar hook-length control protein FliK, partial [Halomonas sp. NCCP-2165]